MDREVANIARRSAADLRGLSDDNLRADIEKTLMSQSMPKFDVLPVASLIVAIAGLAWTISKDIRVMIKDQKKEDLMATLRDELTRKLADEIPHSSELRTEDKRRVIEAVVKETIREIER